MQEEVIQMLASMEPKQFPKIEWMDWPEQALAPWDIQTTQEDEAILLFGNILLNGEGGTWMAPAGIFTSQGAMGGTFYLKQTDGEWQVNGDKGVRWTRQ